MHYRLYIQGIRAVSVVLVLLFHYYNFLPKGYLGVDIFFVLSGFLIGGIIQEKINQSDFSLIDFYLKRINRIIPAQLFMLILVIPFLFFLPNSIFLDHLKEIIFSSISLSNVYYWMKVGYFDVGSSDKLLLHTWSLGVEEQFYLIFPLLMVVLFKVIKHKKALFLLLLFISLVSLLLNTTTIFSESAKFFLIPFRFWEFLIGFFIYNLKDIKLKNSNLFIFISVTAFSLLMYSSFGLSNSIHTIISVLVFSLLFLSLEISKNTNYVKSFLSSKPLVLIGKLSYSLYLSHWIVFYYLYNILNQKNESILGLLFYFITSFSLAIISFYFIENRFRISKNLRSKKAYWQTFIILSLLGFIAITSYLIIDKTRKNCIQFETKQYNNTTVESYFISDSLPSIVFWGDSHVKMLYFDKNIDNYNIYKISAMGCPSLMGTYREDPGKGDCNKSNNRNEIINIIKEISPDHLVLVNRYDIYLNGWRLKGKMEEKSNLLYDSYNSNDYEGRKKTISNALDRTADVFKNSNTELYLVKQIHDFNKFGSSRELYNNGIYAIDEEKLLGQHSVIDSIIDTKNTRFKIINPRSIFTKKNKIVLFESNSKNFTYMDDNHLSQYGGIIYTNYLLSQIDKAK